MIAGSWQCSTAMKFNILVCEGPHTHQAADTAYQFAKAALAGGHEVLRIVFAQDGVYNASCLAAPPIDERNVIDRWLDLSQQHSIKLAICIAASLRRGMMNSQLAEQYGKHGSNLSAGFEVAGMGYFFEGAMVADRTVVFGD